MPLQKSLDGCIRKRIYLLRHSDVSYIEQDGNLVTNSSLVALTDQGIKNAEMTAAMLGEIAFDRAVCSGLKRTVQTAKIVLGKRTKPTLEIYPALEEMRGGVRQRAAAVAGNQSMPPFDPVKAAYSFWDAGKPSAHYLGGESYQEAAQRVQDTFSSLLTEPGWQSMLAVCHGGVNRLLLSWSIGAPLSSMAPFEQDPCCVNILDFDLDEKMKLRRVILRAVNISARDPVKKDRDLTTLEEMAAQMLSKR